MIRFKLLLALLVLAASASPALAETQFAIGEPAPESIKSGVGQISGWAVSDEGVVSVEAFMDGSSLGFVPYGGTRMDVAAAFPDVPNSEYSGWAMKWNYSLLAPGEHTVTIVVTDSEGGQLIQEVVFSTIGFESEFISDPANMQTAGAIATTPEDGRIVILGAVVEGEVVDIELHWDTASQQFLIDRIITEEPPPVPNQAPTADAGPGFMAQATEAVAITGNGSDSDGTIAAWAWQRISGLEVTLTGANTRTVGFTAPESAGTVRLRLTVTDDDGATDSDDVTVTVEAPVPVPNQAPTADAGPGFGVQAGAAVEITGNGSDSDGTIAAWAWQRVSGLEVTLAGANSRTVQFTAPESAGTIRLRLTVTDDDGATDSDDVTVTVEEQAPPPEPDNTTGEILSSWLSTLNAARGQAQTCGTETFPAQPPLSWSGSLADIARQHSMDMAREGYFSHTSSDGTTMGNRVFPYWSGSRVGENIAASSIDRPASYVVNLWLSSPGHCELIMDPNFTHAGIGSGHDSDNGYQFHSFWTLDFGG